MLTFSAGAYRERMIEKRTRTPSKESAHSIRPFIPVERPRGYPASSDLCSDSSGTRTNVRVSWCSGGHQDPSRPDFQPRLFANTIISLARRPASSIGAGGLRTVADYGQNWTNDYTPRVRGALQSQCSWLCCQCHVTQSEDERRC
jgi:hypothetical protein